MYVAPSLPARVFFIFVVFEFLTMMVPQVMDAHRLWVADDYSRLGQGEDTCGDGIHGVITDTVCEKSILQAMILAQFFMAQVGRSSTGKVDHTSLRQWLDRRPLLISDT
jgi:hypothetical protein